MKKTKKMHIGIAPEGATLPLEEGSLIEIKGSYRYEGQPRMDSHMSTDAVTLDEILPFFEDFLRSMGFHFEGHLDIVNEED